MKKVYRVLLVMLAIAVSLSLSTAISFAETDDWDGCDDGLDEEFEITSDCVSVDNVVYNGKYQTGKLYVEDPYDFYQLEEGVDYDVSYYHNKNAGTATVVVTGVGEYWGEVTKHFKITRAPIKKVSAASISPKTYNGKTKRPTVTLKYKGKKLVKGRDYSITYSHNKSVGKAKIVIKGKGNYTGTKTLHFKIRPRGTKMRSVKAVTKGFTAKWYKQGKKMSSSKITGYQLQYARNSSFTKGKHTVKVRGAGKVSKKITGLKSGKKYYVRVRTYKKVNGKTYYSAWSSAKSVTTKKSSSGGSSHSGSSSSGAATSVSGATSGSGGTVYWTPSGEVYHYSRYCRTLSRSNTVYSGTISQSGKSRGCHVCGY